MLAENEANEPNLTISYLPNLTSASQPNTGAQQKDENLAVNKKCLHNYENAFSISVLV